MQQHERCRRTRVDDRIFPVFSSVCTGLLVLALLVTNQASAGAVTGSHPQDTDKKQGTGTIPDGMLDFLAEQVKEGNDERAVTLINQMPTIFGNLTKSEQAKLVKALEKCLGKRRKEEDNRLFIAVVEIFAKMGEPGQKATAKALRNKNVSKRPEVLCAAVRSLGSHGKTTYIKPLQEYLVNQEATVVAAAADAFGFYDKAADKYRKVIVKELLKSYTAIQSNAMPDVQGGRVQRQPGQPVRRPDEKRLNAVKGSFEASLKKLTGESHSGSFSWMQWYNKNKKKRWAARD